MRATQSTKERSGRELCWVCWSHQHAVIQVAPQVLVLLLLFGGQTSRFSSCFATTKQPCMHCATSDTHTPHVPSAASAELTGLTRTNTCSDSSDVHSEHQQQHRCMSAEHIIVSPSCWHMTHSNQQHQHIRLPSCPGHSMHYLHTVPLLRGIVVLCHDRDVV